VKTTIQKYILEIHRYCSKSKDINDLSGKLVPPNLTRFVNEQIISSLPIESQLISSERFSI
jgi:hypothetical protein